MMVIHAKNKNDGSITRLAFSIPIYFEGPLTWTGAAFEAGLEEELSEMWTNGLKAKIPREEFLESYQLFKVQIKEDTKPVKIVAYKGRVLPLKK
jgi:hypothetical protein